MSANPRRFRLRTMIIGIALAAVLMALGAQQIRRWQRGRIAIPADRVVIRVSAPLAAQGIPAELPVGPDCRIDLGRYGKVYVAGLDSVEIKEKLLVFLRSFFADEVLGLSVADPSNPGGRRSVPFKESASVQVRIIHARGFNW